jgi:hypothetical protein
MFNQSYEEQFTSSEFYAYGTSGRILFGLVRIEEHAANMAAGWLQGGWSDYELSDMLSSGLLSTVVECADYVESSRLAEEDKFFEESWNIFFKSLNQLTNVSKLDPEEIKPLLLLLPLTASGLIAHVASSIGLSSKACSRIDTKFLDAMKTKADDLGYFSASTMNSPESRSLLTTSLCNLAREMNPPSGTR